MKVKSLEIFAGWMSEAVLVQSETVEILGFRVILGCARIRGGGSDYSIFSRKKNEVNKILRIFFLPLYSRSRSNLILLPYKPRYIRLAFLKSLRKVASYRSSVTFAEPFTIHTTHTTKIYIQ
jgi:hypothetical protein